jgi:HK97 family phage major capsid protein/HK97 family phage prohead protease
VSAAADDRTRKFSFSSEQPVDRWFGKEILDHDPKSVRTEFINSGRAPYLLNHNRSEQPVGVIEKGTVKIGKDKVGRGAVRFGKTTQAQDALTNVDDGILCNTSVGYRVHEMRFDSEKDGEDTYRVIDWEPHEVSGVTIPADTSVGMGRNLDADNHSSNGATHMADGNGTAAGGNAAGGQGGAAAGGAGAGGAENRGAGDGVEGAHIEAGRQQERRRSATEIETARVRTIRTLATANKIDDRIRDQWIQGGSPIDDEIENGAVKRIGVASELLTILQNRGETKPESASVLGLSEREAKRFSITKMILATRDKQWADVGFELECSRAIASKLGKAVDPNKFFVPLEVQRRQNLYDPAREAYARQNGLIRSAGATNQHLTRADVVGTTTAGGYLVETINLSFIELLRNRTVAFRLGATVLSGLVGNVNIPKQTGAATAMWLSTETTQITEVEQTFGQLAFSPHTIGGYTEISRLLLLQSSPDVEGIVNADLAAIIGIAVDQGVINGAGSAGAPHGIIGLTGVGTGSIASTVLSTLLTIQGTVGAANVVPVRGGWAGTFVVSAGLRGRVEFANTYSPIWYGSVWDGMMLGYPALASNQVPTGDLIFGDWAQVVVAEWGVLEVEVNPYANFQAGIIGVRAIMTVDVGVRYPAAFYVGTSFS